MTILQTFWAKNIAKYGIRYLVRSNHLFSRKLCALRQNPMQSENWQCEYQRDALRRTLEAAAKYIAFYHKKDIAIKQGGNEFELLSRYPVISKKDLLGNRASFYPENGCRRAWWPIGKTSGTTGTPLEIFRSYPSVLYENAFIKRHWEWSGYREGMKRASLRGDVVVPIQKKGPPFWFYNSFENQLILSSRHLRQGCFMAIAEELENFSPYLLESYPSTAYELACFLRKEGRFVNIPYIFTGSEMLYQHQRELIAERFQCKIMDFYGMAERVAFACECEHGNLHLNTDYSFVEILDENNQPTKDYGHIVGTTFYNLVMPLVRYKLSDISKWKPGQCPCGRTFPMIEPIQGKFEDVLYGSEGNPISPSVLTFAFKGVRNIEKSQVAQIAKRRWEVRIVPAAGFTDDDKENLISNIHQLVDPSVEVVVKCWGDIPRTSSAKYRWVVNEWTQEKSQS